MIEQLNQQLANAQGEREQLRQLAEERQSHFEAAQYRIGEIEQTVAALHGRLKDSEAQSAGFATAAALRLSMIEQLNQQLANAQGEREQLRQLAEARQAQFEALQERLKDSEAQSREFATAAAQRLSKIDLLSQQIDSTQNVLSQESATRAMFEQAAAERLVAIEILNSSLSEERAKGELLGKELAAERVRRCDLEEKLARIEELYSSIRQSEVVLLKEVVALREENLIPSIVRRFK